MSMTTRHPPDAVREAVAKALYDFRPGCGWKTVKGRPASYAIPWDEACESHKADAYQEADAVIAALDSRAGDAGEVTDAMVAAALAARLASGTPVLAYLPTESTWEPTDRAKEIVRAILSVTPAPAVDAPTERQAALAKLTAMDDEIGLPDERLPISPNAVDAVPAGEVERLREALAAEAKDWRHNAYTRVMLAQMRDRLSAILSTLSADAIRQAEGIRPMVDAPKDGTMVRLLVDYSDGGGALEDDHPRSWTIGFNGFEDTGEDEWKFAGWCWSHDHFTQGSGEPVGWLPWSNPSTGGDDR